MESLDPKELTLLQLFQLKATSLEKALQLQADLEVQKQNVSLINGELLARESKEKTASAESSK
jgi:hypothetical protein